MSAPTVIPDKLVSVVVACGTVPERTRQCVAALLRHTRKPWELIAVANATGATAAYLAGLADAAPLHVEIVPALTDPAAFPHREGIQAACGDYLALIDDGTVVTDGWLDQLLGLADSIPKAGLIGPMFNDADPPQRAEGCSADILTLFASRWRADHRGQWFTTSRLSGSCLLIRRSLFESIDGITARSTDDLADRVRAAGFELAVARDLFIYRDASDSPTTSDRWAIARLVPKGPGIDVVQRPRRTRARDDAPRPLVSLTMIVRDEAHNLGPCLDSAAGLCEEIIVVDTGSTDDTVEIARSRDAKVVPFTWIDDFAAARNAALDHATGRYAFWLDADDRIDDANRERLATLFAGLHDKPEAAYVMKQLSSGSEAAETTTSADHVRLFPRRDNVRWSYRVHEQILPALRAANVPVRWKRGKGSGAD